MAWLEPRQDRPGYWIRDVRDGRQVFIPAGETREEAEHELERYQIRHDLEKEGYEDQMQALLDILWGSKADTIKKAGYN